MSSWLLWAWVCGQQHLSLSLSLSFFASPGNGEGGGLCMAMGIDYTVDGLNGIDGWRGLRGPNAATGHDKIVLVAHATHRLDYVVFFIWNDLDALELDAQSEAVLGEVGAVGVYGLCIYTRLILPWLVYDTTSIHPSPSAPFIHSLLAPLTPRVGFVF